MESQQDHLPEKSLSTTSFKYVLTQVRESYFCSSMQSKKLSNRIIESFGETFHDFEAQCDRIWQNFATLPKVIIYWKNILEHLFIVWHVFEHKFVMQICWAK